MADDWTMGALAAQNAYAPVDDPWAPPKPSAFNWGGVGEAMPESIGRGYIADPLANAVKGLASLPQQMLTLPQRAFESSESLRGGGAYDPSPALEAAALPMGTGAIAGVPVKGAEAVLGAGAVRKVKPKMGDILGAVDEEAEPAIAAPAIQRPSPIERYVIDPQRIYKPGIYQDPRIIAAEANARVAPEHPALKELFGVTRGDLYDISQQGTRQGNVAPNIWQPSKPGGSRAAENIMNPANAQRLVDTLTEARKYPGLEQGMVPWYVMDPAFHRMVELVGPERAISEYNKFNMSMTPFSASSDVMKEINRGTAARMMAERGQFEDFAKYGGMPVAKRGADFPSEMTDVIPHLRHGMHVEPVQRWLETGQHGYGDNTVKIPLYSQASGVPQTGFQTAWPVPDAHFTRAIGMSDVRTNATPGNFMVGPEYRTMSPWFREHVAQPLGIEAVPTQALTWGTYAPQTGVKTPIGAGKLELMSQRIWERAKKLGVDPKELRDKVLLGQEHAQLEGGMGSLVDQDNYG